MSDNDQAFGQTERTYRLRTKDGKFAWIFDDDGEVLEGKMFSTLPEAQEWIHKRCGGHWLKFLPLLR